jgi:predicted RNase H-like nuclease (RuvC/YqgF family)
MENSFDRLEEKVRKAAELVKRLRKENGSLEEALDGVKVGLQEAEKRLAALEKERSASAGQGKELEGLEREVKALRQQRDEVRHRIEKLVDVLERLDEPSEG